MQNDSSTQTLSQPVLTIADGQMANMSPEDLARMQQQVIRADVPDPFAGGGLFLSCVLLLRVLCDVLPLPRPFRWPTWTLPNWR